MGGSANPAKRSDRWAAHREARRAELIAAVVAAVRQRGPAIDMDDITEVSGIAKPIFYRYFKDKTDLYLAVGRDAAERLVDEVVAAVDGSRSPREMLSAGIDAFLLGVERDPELYRFVLQRPATASAVSDYSAVVGLHISRLTGDLLRESGLDSGVAEPWGFAIVGAVRTAAERWLDQRSMSREALAASLTDLLWAGAGSAAAGVRRPATGDRATVTRIS
jgi:AcrR family transcriptional regulator